MKIKKLLSLFSAAAISASCFAGMAITASAEESQMYGEWLLNAEYQSKTEPYVLAGTDGKLPDGTTDATIMNYSKGNAKAAPMLYYNRTPAAQRANAYSIFREKNVTFATYGGETITASRGFKSSGGYGYTFVLDPKLKENNAISYNLKIAFWSNASEATDTTSEEDKLKIPLTLKIVALDELAFGKVANGEAITTETSANNKDLKEVTISDIKSAVSFGFENEHTSNATQSGIAYVGIEYTPAPAFEGADAAVEMKTNADGGAHAAAAYATVKISDLNEKALKWSITANNGTKDSTQTIDATYESSTLSGGGDAVLGLLISDIPDGTTIKSAKIILE